MEQKLLERESLTSREHLKTVCVFVCVLLMLIAVLYYMMENLYPFINYPLNFVSDCTSLLTHNIFTTTSPGWLGARPAADAFLLFQ